MKELILENITKSFGDKTVLRGLSGRFPPGSVSCLMGPSGEGKTTLLNILMGFLPPDSGRMEGLPRRITAVFQEDRLCEGLSALTNVRITAAEGVTEEEIRSLLTRLGLGDASDKPVSRLSGGMRRRTALARALLGEGELLLLDEPFKGLDEDTRRRAALAAKEYFRGRTVLLVSHDREEARLLGARLFFLREGQLFTGDNENSEA